jgi:hypothetical protein
LPSGPPRPKLRPWKNSILPEAAFFDSAASTHCPAWENGPGYDRGAPGDARYLFSGAAQSAANGNDGQTGIYGVPVIGQIAQGFEYVGDQIETAFNAVSGETQNFYDSLLGGNDTQLTAGGKAQLNGPTYQMAALECQGLGSSGCQSGGSFGTTGAYQGGGRVLCQWCIIKYTGSEGLPSNEQLQIITPFLRKPNQ